MMFSLPRTNQTIIRTLFVSILLFSTAAMVSPSFSAAPPPRVDLREVTVGGEIGRRIDITIDNNLLVLDVDNDFLMPFQKKEREDGYIGLGKLIDGLVRLSAYSGNKRLIDLKNRVVAETLKTQEQDGYIGIIVPARRMWALWDIHEMNYLVNGLVSDYRFFNQKKSLDAAVKLMDYIITNWEANPDGLKDIDITVFMAVTGLEETLLMLYDATGEKRFLDFCVDFRKLPEWDYGIVLGRWGEVGGHAYAYFHRCLAQLRLDQIQPDPVLLKQTRRTLEFLTEKDGLTINGVCGQHECWHDTQDGTAGLGETCATAYYIRVLDELIRMEQNSIYGDLMERSIYNGLFAAQSPDGRRLRYYVPFEGPRVYFDGDTYCCPCNYRRIIAELPSMIYYKQNGGIAVNLYTPSEVKLNLKDKSSKPYTIQLKQETDYPNSGKVKISIEPSRSVGLPIQLRIPRWCENANVSINGETPIPAPGGEFLSLDRTWKKGDRIELDMPMPWRFIEGRQAQSGRIAVMRGPQLFCLNRAKNEAVADADLRAIGVDPGTIEGPFPNNTVRPDGMACRIKGWKEMGFSRGGDPDLTLTLTEFPDPDGEMVYFRIHQIGLVGTGDELIHIASQHPLH